MRELLNRLKKSQSGQVMPEYGLLMALVAIAVIATLGILSGSVHDVPY